MRHGGPERAERRAKGAAGKKEDHPNGAAIVFMSLTADTIIRSFVLTTMPPLLYIHIYPLIQASAFETMFQKTLLAEIATGSTPCCIRLRRDFVVLWLFNLFFSSENKRYSDVDTAPPRGFIQLTPCIIHRGRDWRVYK